ncbi:hypothetical protein GCM10007872_09130 [Gluconobacter sphaericus NBRC 12467]|uniref:DDE domain-containing protein n=1 Tax=Gluconobacter sphaericus NBRC 12467 TaxID=1307951 RepID=A0AA37W9I6_9PROT|nr:hypothetical protein GSP01_22380 [Gluconobacter sphaericus NBRC 12467]GLQ84005.1 hypothetical protein GCM10007872_09130 [Gluconobacter sphaericus NBRC 12467]
MPSSDLAIPFFCCKSHISIDGKFRFIHRWKTTDAAANEDVMEKHGFVSKVHITKSHLKPMPPHIQKSNAGKSVIRSRVEHIFVDQKSQTELFIRAVGITWATIRIGLANIV